MALAPDEKISLLRDPIKRAELGTMANTAQGSRRQWADWGGFYVAQTFSGQNKQFEGRSVTSIAESLGLTPWDALVDLVISDNLKTVLMREDKGQDKKTWDRRVSLWRDPRVMVGASDAGAHLDMTDGFSCSTTVLQKAVRERGLISLEEAIFLLTKRPAELYGLRGRGVIAEGACADLVVFDPETVGVGPISMQFDLPGGAGRVFAGATGILHVFINGAEAVSAGEFTDDRPGEVLRSGRDSETVSTR